jgi:hypothetical protein
VSVWFVIPSKRPHPEVGVCLGAWRDMGYEVAVARERADGSVYPFASHNLPVHSYLGWARSVNLIVGKVMAEFADADWFVTGGDDYWPDPHRRAEEIAAECSHHFAAFHAGPDAAPGVDLSVKSVIAAVNGVALHSFGVMQPTGDRWGEGRCTTCNAEGRVVAATTLTQYGVTECLEVCPDCHGTRHSAVIDRICGSPWMGREFCRRMYHGSGPLYNGYYHNFADEELQNVARKLGVFRQRRDLNQEHRHWAQKQPKSATHTGLAGDVRNMPEWARKINDPKLSDWERSKALFAKRKANGFPGHEPLEV